ncbi:MAG: hypothetical protein GY863_08485, partial [bacterium]|nr:hypothetical protein [bacterium]
MKRNISKLVWITAAVLMIFIIGCKGSGEPGVFRSNWHDASERIWIGPEYWANRLQDWKIANSRLECVFSGNNRNVHILTRQIGSEPGGFDITFHAAMINRSAPQVSENWIGCRIGAKGRFNDYRDSAIFGVGIDIGVTASGELFIGDKKTYPVVSIKEMLFEQLILKVSCKTEYGINKIDLSLIDQETGETIAFLQKDGVSDEEMKGNISLVSSFPEHEGDRNTSSAWFSELSISGEKIEKYEDRAFGPVLFVQYTLSRNIMKMTAQMPPTGEKDEKTVRLQI